MGIFYLLCFFMYVLIYGVMVCGLGLCVCSCLGIFRGEGGLSFIGGRSVLIFFFENYL